MCTVLCNARTDIYIYIYKYRGISNRTRLLASLRSRCSAVIHFRHPRKRNFTSLRRFSCSETPIQYTDSYKYLVVEFTEYLSWAKSVENTAIPAAKAASYLFAKTRSSSAFLFTTYRHLYTTQVLPIIRRHYRDVYLGMSPIQNGGCYLMY